MASSVGSSRRRGPPTPARISRSSPSEGEPRLRRPRHPANGEKVEAGGRIPKGERNTRLYAHGRSLHAQGRDSEKILAELLHLNRTCDPPLPEREIEDIARQCATQADAPGFRHDPDLEDSTDDGIGRLFLRHHREDARFVSDLNRWVSWDGKRFREDSRDHIRVTGLARGAVLSLYGEAEKAATNEERDELVRRAKAGRSMTRIRNAISLVRSEVLIEANHLDADPWLFNVENGTIDLRTGELRAHRRENLLTRLAPVKYDPGADYRRWLDFLERGPARSGRSYLLAAPGRYGADRRSPRGAPDDPPGARRER